MEDAPADRLTLALDGWEGPLDLLLTLARAQRVDLRELSILALVEQYLDWLAQSEARADALRLEVAADWLVMAAWLAYLKSALLLPRDPLADPDPDELATRLQLRLQRLDAMREAGARLMARDRTGREVFPRGAPEGLAVLRRPLWDADLYDLLAAYGAVQVRTAPVLHRVRRRAVLTLEQALARLVAMLGAGPDWVELRTIVPALPDNPRSALASTFLATLELARQGRVEIDQNGAFAPLRLRAS